MYLLVSDKWDTYALRHEDGVEHAALDLVQKRLSQGFWYDEQASACAAEIVREEDGDKALQFLHERSDHEYELVEVKYD